MNTNGPVDRHWTLKVGEVLYAGRRHAESFPFPDKYADCDTFVGQVPDWLL